MGWRHEISTADFTFIHNNGVSRNGEMKFLDINLTKDSSTSLLLHVVCSAFYLRFLKKTILYSGLKNPYKKSKKQE